MPSQYRSNTFLGLHLPDITDAPAYPSRNTLSRFHAPANPATIVPPEMATDLGGPAVGSVTVSRALPCSGPDQPPGGLVNTHSAVL